MSGWHRSDAVISVLRLIGGRGCSALLRIIPRTIRDWGYGIIARNRYRIFGKAIPAPAIGESTSLPDV
jgi:predicted DCC family thiol-disulfide oxidoreductase YuxK